VAVDIPTHDPGQHRSWWRALNSRRPDGPGTRADSATALLALGVRSVHPGDVLATVHKTRATALLAARANREAHGHPTLGVARVEGAGWVAVVDLRPGLAALGVPPTPVGVA
jgi:hypothetical protein